MNEASLACQNEVYQKPQDVAAASDKVSKITEIPEVSPEVKGFVSQMSGTIARALALMSPEELSSMKGLKDPDPSFIAGIDEALKIKESVVSHNMKVDPNDREAQNRIMAAMMKALTVG